MLTYEVAPGFLVDPAGQSPLITAAMWLQNTLLGPIATTTAVICVASVGWLMLSGRLDVRRGVIVVLGCFVLFGSATIVQGFHGAGNAPSLVAAQQDDMPPPPAQIDIPEPSHPPDSYDPYAGASVRR